MLISVLGGGSFLSSSRFDATPFAAPASGYVETRVLLLAQARSPRCARRTGTTQGGGAVSPKPTLRGSSKEQAGDHSVGAGRAGHTDLYLSTRLPHEVLTVMEIGHVLRVQQNTVGIQNVHSLGPQCSVPIQTVDRHFVLRSVLKRQID